MVSWAALEGGRGEGLPLVSWKWGGEFGSLKDKVKHMRRLGCTALGSEHVAIVVFILTAFIPHLAKNHQHTGVDACSVGRLRQLRGLQATA